MTIYYQDDLDLTDAVEAAAREAFPDLVTCRGCGDLREPDTICQRCQARRDAAARRRRLHRLESRPA